MAWLEYRFVYDPKTEKVVPKAVGRYTQFPLMPAWAVTIHKAQGKTIDRVMVDFGAGAFATGQVYVALSRTRSLAGIVIIGSGPVSDGT